MSGLRGGLAPFIPPAGLSVRALDYRPNSNPTKGIAFRTHIKQFSSTTLGTPGAQRGAVRVVALAHFFYQAGLVI